MSIKVEVKSLSAELRKKIHLDLTLYLESEYAKQTLYAYDIRGNPEIIYLPYAYAKSMGFNSKSKEEYPSSNFTYKRKEFPLREEQVKVKDEVISILNEQNSCIMAPPTGFGKTALSLYIASILKLKVLYINNNLTIIDQIYSSIQKFTTAKAQIVHPKDIINPDCDIYIINSINVSKFSESFFNNIGTLIIDEVHCILSKVFSRCMHYINPKYLIGLSATPYREDGLNKLFDLYFGENKIIRKLNKYHRVYKINSPIKPIIKTTSFGKLDWNAVIDSLSDNKIRNEKCIEILRKFNDRVFIVPCKRVSQVEYLYNRLVENGENVDALYGKKKTYNPNCRILIGTTKKIGIGFDNPRTDAILLACDMESYFIQALGRSMRTPTVEPIVIDIVDSFHSLYKHWKTREEVYKDHGGEIFNLNWDTLTEGNLIENEFKLLGVRKQ